MVAGEDAGHRGAGRPGRSIVERLVRPDGVVQDPEAVDLHVEGVAVIGGVPQGVPGPRTSR